MSLKKHTYEEYNHPDRPHNNDQQVTTTENMNGITLQ